MNIHLIWNKKQILISSITLGAIFVAYKLFGAYKQKYRSKNSLQGPKPSDPKLGNFSDMSGAGSLHEYIEQLTNTYGHIGAFWWGSTRVAYISSQKILCNEENKKILSKLSHRPPFLFEGFKPLIGDDSIQYANGENFHARYKGIFLKAYQRNMTGKIPIMVKLSNECLNKWEQDINESKDDNIIVSIMDDAFIFAAKSVIYASFGSHINDELVASIISGYKITWNEMEKRLIDGIPPDHERSKQFQQSLHSMHDTVREIIKENEQINNKNGLFLKLISENQELYNTENKILDEVVTAITGGTHTTGNGLTWLFYYISMNLQIQENIYKEIKKYWDSNKYPLNKMEPTSISSILKELIYSKQVINETLRISCLAPWSARINNNNDMIINKCDGSNDKILIPKGMAFIIEQGIALNDPTVFKNPTIFNPDRWSKENLKKSTILWQSTNAIFGGVGGNGERLCPGWSFFRTEALIFLIQMVSKFKFSLSNEDINVSKGIKRKYGLVTSPSQTIKIKVTKR